MARIRTIKPEFWTSEQVAECSTTARLLFIGLWNFCDDGGRHPDSAMRLKMEVFPADPISADEIEAMLGQLIDSGLIERYTAQDKDWIQVTGWQHQRIDKPQFRYPDKSGRIPSVEQSSNVRPRNGLEGNGNRRSTRQDKDDHVRMTADQKTEAIRQRAKAVVDRLGKPATKPEDRSLVLKAAAMTLRAPFSEHWLYDAAEGVATSSNGKGSKYGYLHQCLKNSTEQLGKVFNTELAKTRVPPEAEDFDVVVDLSQRMCGVPDD